MCVSVCLCDIFAVLPGNLQTIGKITNDSATNGTNATTESLAAIPNLPQLPSNIQSSLRDLMSTKKITGCVMLSLCHSRYYLLKPCPFSSEWMT